MDSIKLLVTTETLVNVSVDVSNKVGKVQQAFNDLNNLIMSTNQYWEGVGHNAFEEAYNIRKDDYESILTSMYDYVIKLQEMAGVYSQAEQVAMEESFMLPSDAIF